MLVLKNNIFSKSQYQNEKFLHRLVIQILCKEIRHVHVTSLGEQLIFLNFYSAVLLGNEDVVLSEPGLGPQQPESVVRRSRQADTLTDEFVRFVVRCLLLRGGTVVVGKGAFEGLSCSGVD